MKREKILKLFVILVGVMMMMSLGCNKVQASEITSVFSGETLSRDTIGDVVTLPASSYARGISKTLGITKSNYKTNDGDGKYFYWTIKDTDGTYKDLYCLNVERGFENTNGEITNFNSIKEYKNQYELNDISDSDYNKYTGTDSAIKNKVLWILNNSLTEGSATLEEDFKVILAAASKKVDGNTVGLPGITTYVKNDMKNNADTRTALTLSDVKVIQQIVLWHYTNPGSIFDNTISAICTADGKQISAQGEKIEIDTATNYYEVRSGLIKQAKINAVYQYFIDGAESGSSETEKPTLTLSNSDVKINETDTDYIVGPFLLTGEKTELIKSITSDTEYQLLNNLQKEVTNNDFTKVIGKNFYLRISRDKVTSSTDINLNLRYTYNVNNSTLLTDANDLNNTQAVGYVTTHEEYTDIKTNATIELIDVIGTKTWDDSDNQDGIRPESITVNLLANGSKIASQIVTADNNWKIEFTKLLKYKNGIEMTYTITEDKITGYTQKIEGYNITNTHIPDTIEVKGKKSWNDDNNQDGKRPQSITVNLLANGVKVDSKTVKSPWSFSFTNLPKYEAGEEIAYTIDEEAISGYTKSISGYNITNTYTPQLTSVSGTKIWDDDNDRDRKRPESITVNLLENGTKVASKTVTQADSWKYSFTNLPRYKSGKEITYTITENTVDGYTTRIDGYNITNSHTPETRDVSGEKVWEDNNNQDGKRPESIIVNLLANGKKVDSKTVTSANDWKFEFTDVPEYESGTRIRYTITEDEVEGYETEFSGDVYSGLIIKNIHTPETTKVEGTKTWDDNNNQDGIRPENIIVNLLANGEEVDSKTVKSPWNFSFTNLPKYEAGKEITYTITENKVDRYTTTIEGYNITNKHIPEITQKIVTKIWDDNNNQDGKRAEYGITLKANGKICSEEVRLSANETTYTFSNLPKFENGEEIVYTVEETKIPSEYKPSYSEDTFTITNKYTPGLLEKTVIKKWDDNNNQDGKRAEYGVTLKANGKICSEEVRLSANETTYTWSNLPKFENGEEIVYTVEETTKPSGYIAEYSEDTFTITNKYIPEITQKTVTKIWDDNNNQDGKRAEYGVTLKANGKICREEVILNANETTYTWSNLPKFENGKEIVYTVEETTKPSGYTAEYSEDTFTVTNKYTPGTINKKVIKEWNDNNNQDGIRPTDITVKLYKTVNGEKIELESRRLNETNNWMHTWTSLKEKENGETIIYSIEENVVNGYVATYSAEDYSNVDEITITNTHIPVEITGKYNLVLRKVDENGNILTGSKFKVSGTEYNLSEGEVILYENQEITSETNIELTYIIEETLVPAGYTGIENTEINIKAQVLKVNDNYKVIRAILVDGDGNTIVDENICIKLEGQSIVIEVKNIPLEEKEFDLSLRKFITKINDETYSREPVVDTSTIASTRTATYKHSKQPIAVQKGDIVTYKIRVYNEGEVDGYVEKITDHLPDHLLPIIAGTEGIDEEKYAEEIEFNLDWGWIVSEDGKSVVTTKTSKVSSETYSLTEGYENVTDTKLEAYVPGSNNLDYIDVQIKCLVTDSAISGEYLTNIAEITEAKDINGKQWDGLDSELNNADYNNISDYKNNEAINSTIESYIPGQEDDDDFEKLVVKEFDLALRKFITKVNETSYSREPKVDTSKLGTSVDGKTITTATYIHSKEPIIVETSDIVTYVIRVYNEGTIAGFANEITDNIPEGLEFMANSDINVSYRWTMLDKDGKETEDITKAVMIKTDYLSDRDSNNIIREVTENEGIKTLSYKDVEVQFKVIAKAEKLKDNIIINEAQISADSDRDIDSVPNRDEKYDYVTGKNEDDIDYEPIKLQYFDLALRKFITKVNSTDYNNRYPEVIYNEDGSIKYNHTKDPVLVTTGDIVTYTIRVYNEGEKAGCATQIIDNLPDGLEFLPENETNKKFGWKLLDNQGNVTEDITKAEKATTNILEKEIIDALVQEGDQRVLTYKDVQIAFKVVEPTTSDRILVNTAQIAADSDDDIDSIPNNNIEAEDDLDKEYVRVEYFDLALKKWVTATKVTLDGKTTTTKTGFTEDSEGIAKVDIVASKLKKTTVKFVYSIKVTNEGELPGYAYEVKDYIPNGLKFNADDNKDWKEEKDGTVVTDKLKDTILNPGESATVEIVLTWKNSSTNLGIKTNYAEISKDSADDIDSTPDNNNLKEDDIDDAQVILSIKTAGTTTYIGLVLISVAVLAVGIFSIKKYVLDK